jgi:hypothetical protein
MIRVFATAFALLAPAAVQSQVLDEFPRAANGRPDLSGIWQAMNTAHWNLEPTPGGYPVLLELGAQFAVPPGPGVVVGGEIPYLPEARAERDRRFENRLIDDPEAKCFIGGVPRSTYMPYPFQILQNEHDVVIYYQFATAFRRIFVDGKEEAPLDAWMGWSNGRWDGNTFVVDVTGLNGLAWLDRAGNYASASARITERYTPLGPNHLQYEATIDDATVYSRPWTIRMPLYRVVDENFRILEFKCEPYAEEKIYGHLRKPGTEPPAGASSQ